MADTKQSRLLQILADKGYSPEIAESDHMTSISWKTKKSIYEVQFDQQGETYEAKIDGFSMRKVVYGLTPEHRRIRWTCETLGMPRVYTFEKWLGMRLFEDQ